MCIVIIYDAVRAIRFAGLETIHNNDAAIINFTGSRVTVLTHFRSGSCTHETPWVIGVSTLVPRGQSSEPTHQAF